MEIAIGCAYLLFTVLVAAKRGFSASGWLYAWSSLGFLSSLFLIYCKLFGENAGWLARVTLALGILYVSVPFWNDKSKLILNFKRSGSILFLNIVVSMFFLVRNLFPQFDVDSLNYHLPGVLWNIERLQLQVTQQSAEVISLWHLLVGFEEFLLVPAYGKFGDIAVLGGIVGGILKLLSYFSLSSLIPGRSFLLSALAASLLIADEHFFFSGLSRYVYISPAMIGLVLLLGHFSWRGLNLHPSSIWGLISSALLLSTVKYHGNIFLIGAVILFCIILIIRKSLGKCLFPPMDSFTFNTIFPLSIFSWSTNHFLRWWETGSPIPPYKLLFFSLENFGRGTERLENITFQGNLIAAFNPNLALRFPGIYSSQMVLVLFLPALVWGAVSIWKRPMRSWRSSLVSASLFMFLFTYAWSVVALVIREDESRYPRYVLGCGILGICLLILSFRKLANWKSEKLVCISAILNSKEIGAILGFSIFAATALTVDTRYRNISFDHRPSWANLFEFSKVYFNEQAPYLAPGRKFMSNLMLPLNESAVPPLKRCLANLSEEEGDSSYLLGNRIMVFGPNAVWPSWLVAPHAAIGSISEGGGFLKIPVNKTLYDIGYRFAIVPRDKNLLGEFPLKSDLGQPLPLPFHSQPICHANEMELVRLKKSFD